MLKHVEQKDALLHVDDGSRQIARLIDRARRRKKARLRRLRPDGGSLVSSISLAARQLTA
jgi:hypothetical protein